MFDRNLITNQTLLVWILSSMSSFAYSMESEEPISGNKIQQSWVRFSSDYVRCFCNLPQCVSTGYMCKSIGGGCFSNFLDQVGHHSKDYLGRHGCVELLNDKENRGLCENQHLKKKSLMFCCYHDMCNHVDSPQTKDLINKTLLGESPDFNQQQQLIDYTNSQVWFRAATIAVPVCGAVILFVLIALAIKILRSENQNSTRDKLGVQQGCENISRNHQQKCVYHHNPDLQKVQVPLLIQNEINTHHSGNKNETNAKLDLMQNEHLVVLDIEKMSRKCSNPNVDFVNEKLFISSINH